MLRHFHKKMLDRGKKVKNENINIEQQEQIKIARETMDLDSMIKNISNLR